VSNPGGLVRHRGEAAPERPGTVRTGHDAVRHPAPRGRGALGGDGHEVMGCDGLEAPSTTVVGSVTDRTVVRAAVRGVDAVLHAATLHKPHVGSHPRQSFIDTNVTGTVYLVQQIARRMQSRGQGRILLTGSQQRLVEAQPVFGALDTVFVTVRERTEYR